MKDFAELAPRVTGTFPNVAALDDIVPGDKTGTPLAKAWVTELFGAFQAILDYASLTPSGVAETASSSQILTALQTSFIDGLAGGTYSPSASLTWNQALIVDASAGAGTNVVGITSTGKGTGNGGIFYGGASGSMGIKSYGGGSGAGGEFTGGDGTSLSGVGIVCYGGDSSAGVGARGVNAFGGEGSTYGGAGVFGYGGAGITDDGPGGYFRGHGGSDSLTFAGQGAIIAGGSAGADALWVVTNTGSEPTTKKSDYAIWASTGGAFPAAAISGRSDLGYGLVGITYEGIGISCTAVTTGSPFRIIPKSAAPTTNLSEGCFYFDSGTHTLHYYDGSNWQQVAIV